MILSRYGIRLRSLAYKDLEILREARNQNHIRTKMIYRNIISKKEQELWYSQLNPISDFYFIIEIGEKSYGLINVRDIDHKTRRSESGLFIWDKAVLKSHIPVLASWLLSEAGFGIIGGKDTMVKVLKNNLSAIEFNKKIGFKIIKEKKDILIMQQSKNDFSTATIKDREKLIQALKLDNTMKISFEDHENDKIFLNHFLLLVEKNPQVFSKISEKEYLYKVTF